jgi:hypothetical protein
MLTVLGGLAEFERELIRARDVANGVKFGGKPTLTHHQQREAIKRRDAGEPIREIARTYNVSTFLKDQLNQNQLSRRSIRCSCSMSFSTTRAIIAQARAGMARPAGAPDCNGRSFSFDAAITRTLETSA